MEFNTNYIKASLTNIDNCKINIKGSILNFQTLKYVVIIAPNTFDKKSSYSGQGLPFPCASIAFDNTTNKHVVQSSGMFDINFDYPNSYYTVANKKRIISTIYFCLIDHDDKMDVQLFELEDLYPLRTIINRESRNGPEFYSTKYDVLPVDTAENLMYQYSELKKNLKIG